MRKTGMIMLTILMLAGCGGKRGDVTASVAVNKLGTSLKEAVSEYQAEQAYLKDAERYEALLFEIKKYDNGLSDDDYAGQEICLHDRGLYENGEVTVQIYSEPHIYYPYIVDITLKGESAKRDRTYVDSDSYEDIQNLLESYGFVRQ